MSARRSPAWRRYLRFWGSNLPQDVDEELRFHYEMRVAELVATGLSKETAAQRAAREFGDIDDARRYVAVVDGATEANVRRRDLMTSIIQDVPRVVRRLRRSPGTGRARSRAGPPTSRLMPRKTASPIRKSRSAGRHEA